MYLYIQIIIVIAFRQYFILRTKNLVCFVIKNYVNSFKVRFIIDLIAVVYHKALSVVLFKYLS